MGNAHFDSLSAEQREAAFAALRNVLGSAPIDAVTPLKGGATAAAILRIDAGKHRYLLRIEGAPSPLRNSHQYVSLRIATDAGIAPRLYYCDDVARIAVMDFVVQRPLSAYPGGPFALAQAIGELVRRLQSTELFPYFVDYPDIVARLWAHVCRTGLFAPGVLDPANERLAAFRDAYAWDRTGSVSSHNDLIPANILFDGQCLWLVDWESAYRNDPLVDVAIALDNLARTPELEAALLRAWLGRPPGDELDARLKLTRALTRLYYAGVFFSASATFPRTAPNTDVTAPSLADFQRALSDGRLKPGTGQTKHVLGKMFLAAFMTDVLTPGFNAAVAEHL
jgi:aminoglycoside phosphotransferase (APT) family kinase protein